MASGLPGPQDSKPAPRNQIPGNLWFWWLVLAGLMVWNVLSLWPRGPERADIPYSTFLAQIRAGNVSAVHIIGDRISGDFVKPLMWPPPSSHPAATRPAPAASEPAKMVASSEPRPTTGQEAEPLPAPYPGFRTTFPAAVGDPGLMPLLESHNVTVNVSPSATPWFLDLLLGWLPMLALIGFFWLMARRAGQAQSGMFGIGRMKARRYNSDQPKVTFNDVAGANEAKADLQEEVDFLRHPQKYRDLGARIPKGVLLVGAPGTGKTLLARAVAGEAECPSSASTRPSSSRCLSASGPAACATCFARPRKRRRRSSLSTSSTRWGAAAAPASAR